eukprot:NODE_2654_length_2172_cov_3.005379.p1 GENE.NODE_2654_length_2172_cov_3.005379~~NODE_2654_length_2172_cov_3.005379.p1  ORF type:complete len:309 (+),score=96.02 NODE_2654_length_2172_cov_3.005379:423-1349(+)
MVDFSHLSEAGRELGWRPVFYGPQVALEQAPPLMLLWRSGGTSGVATVPVEVPGYLALLQDASKQDTPQELYLAALGFYGSDESGWTAPKVLLQFKPPPTGVPGNATSPLERRLRSGGVVFTPGFPLSSTEVDVCWAVDATMVPEIDVIRNSLAVGQVVWWVEQLIRRDPMAASNIEAGYFLALQDIMLATRVVDYLVALHGCARLRRAPKDGEPLAEEGLDPWPLWGLVWNSERLRRMADGLLHVVRQALRPETARELLVEREPWVCMARRAAQLLCGVDLGSSQRPRGRHQPASPVLLPRLRHNTA